MKRIATVPRPVSASQLPIQDLARLLCEAEQGVPKDSGWRTTATMPPRIKEHCRDDHPLLTLGHGHALLSSGMVTPAWMDIHDGSQTPPSRRRNTTLQRPLGFQLCVSP
ncbi:hypothetical protein VTI28DRAFT_8689 [Corynascus sepedonium]